MAASTRNPLHLLAGSNDYRTVDIPGCAHRSVTGKCIEPETGDAWLGLFKSKDGGQRWTSTLLPGYPQDCRRPALASPLKGYQAGADAVVRAGTNGLIYYSGLVFDRGENGKSAVFLSRFIDNNNQEAGDPVRLSRHLAGRSSTGQPGTPFLDKPWMAVDIPRGNATFCIVTDDEHHPDRQEGEEADEHGRQEAQAPAVQRIPAGAIYVTYTAFTGEGPTLRSEVMFKRSHRLRRDVEPADPRQQPQDRVNQGATIAIDPRNGAVFVAWRRFDPDLTDNNDLDAMMVARAAASAPANSTRRAARTSSRSSAQASSASSIASSSTAADERTTCDPGSHRRRPRPVRPRHQRLQLPHQRLSDDGRRRHRPHLHGLDGTRLRRPTPMPTTARASSSRPRATGARSRRSRPVEDHDTPGRGHQLMPSLTFAGGKLMLVYYDLRETRRSPPPVRSTTARSAMPTRRSGTPSTSAPRWRAGRDAGLRPLGARLGLPDGHSIRDRTPSKQLQVEPAEPADVQAGHRAVHGRLHRRRRGAGVRAERRREVDLQHRGRPAAAGVPRGVDRQPRRAAAEDAQSGDGNLDWTDYTPPKMSPVRAANQHLPDPARRCPSALPRQRRLAQPEHLHRAHHRAACSSDRPATPSRCRPTCSAPSWCSRRTPTDLTRAASG